MSNSNNSKESLQAINELFNKKSKTTQVKEINVEGKTWDEKIEAGFNEYFSTIGSKLSERTEDSDIDPLNFVTPVHDICFQLYYRRRGNRCVKFHSV